MNLTIDLYMWISAVLPIILLLILMIKFRISIVKSSAITLIITLLISKFIYKANLLLIKVETLKGIWSSLNILLVVWAAIFLYEVINKAQVFKILKNELHTIISNKTLQVLTLGWVFASFLQGITGFGVPVAICSPLLVGIGIDPISAVVITLLGQAWGSTFGTLALAWDALVNQTSLSTSKEIFIKTAIYSAIFIWIWNFISGCLILLIYKKNRVKILEILTVFFISFIHGFGQLLFIKINSTLANFIPSIIAIIGILFIDKLPCFEMKIDVNKKIKKDSIKQLNKSFFTYYILTFLTLVFLLIKPIKNFLNRFNIGLSFPKTETGYNFINYEITNYSPIYFFTHASLFLFISAISGYIYYRNKNWIDKPELKSIFYSVTKKAMPSTLTIISLIIISKLMSGSGQIYVLSQGIAKVISKSYIFISPFIGLLGSFITSSNMASNILFGSFQETTARALNLNLSLTLAAQTVGGSIGSTLAPGNIILGAMTTNILGKEDKILKKIMPISLLSAALIGVIATGMNIYLK